jgi:adenylate cyclase
MVFPLAKLRIRQTSSRLLTPATSGAKRFATVTTVVFADLVGSTGIFERLGDETASVFVTQITSALSKVFEQHNGRVVKLLGDGLFVVFPSDTDALSACVSIQVRLHENPVRPGGEGPAVQMQMGIESGEVVEIDGDCFGDAVNSAARLADLAGADQILTTQRVRDALIPMQQAQLRSLGPMHLRGKAEVTQVFRVEWQTGRDADATIMGTSMAAQLRDQHLQISGAGQTVALKPQGERLSLGRAVTASLSVNDSRVSRVHATIEWRGSHFVLSDASSFGTWVYVGGQTEPVVLRRTECYLVGRGEIVLGCERGAENAPVVQFSVQA